MFRSLTSVVAATALGLVLAACGGSATRLPNADTRIVLDQSIGGVALREKRADVEHRLGRGIVLKAEDQKPPDPISHAEDVLYAKHGLEVWYVSRNATKVSRERGRVIIVLTHSPRYVTPEGVHVGAPARTLNAIKGVRCSLADCQHGYNALNHPGTTFRLDYPDGRVVMIAVAFGH